MIKNDTFVCVRCKNTIDTSYVIRDCIFACPKCGYPYIKDIIGKTGIYPSQKYFNHKYYGTKDEYGNEFKE